MLTVVGWSFTYCQHLRSYQDRKKYAYHLKISSYDTLCLVEFGPQVLRFVASRLSESLDKITEVLLEG